jgi:predicted nucleotidyltransferase
VISTVDKAIETIKNTEGFENVRFIILYGSVAAGQMRKDSDIDLCIYYEGSAEEWHCRKIQ